MSKLQFAVNIPPPSRYVSHDRVDDIANEIRKAFDTATNNNADFIDVVLFVHEALNKDLVWRPIPEPEDRICFASIDSVRISLNEIHSSLFKSKPFILRSCLSHEIGHEVLGHLDLLSVDENQGTLFESKPTSEIIFHDSRWSQFNLSRDELRDVKNELARQSFADPEIREMLRTLEDKLEPEWMFYQAEQFAACFLIPRDRLFDHLETGLDISKWPNIYKLAEIFGVSASMMKVRLEKLKLIETDGKEVTLVRREIQGKLDSI